MSLSPLLSRCHHMITEDGISLSTLLLPFSGHQLHLISGENILVTCIVPTLPLGISNNAIVVISWGLET